MIDGIRRSDVACRFCGSSGLAPVEADAVSIRPDEAARARASRPDGGSRRGRARGRALKEHDPEIFLISSAGRRRAYLLELALELLPDVPAGKLAIADVDVGDREEVLKSSSVPGFLRRRPRRAGPRCLRPARGPHAAGRLSRQSSRGWPPSGPQLLPAGSGVRTRDLLDQISRSWYRRGPVAPGEFTSEGG